MKIKKETLHVRGMHCASCNVLIEDKFKEVDNIHNVKANYNKCQVEIHYSGHLDKNKLNKKISSFGYQIAERDQVIREPFLRRLADVATLAGIMFILYFFAQEINIIPSFDTSAGASLTYISVFILGLVASTSTCMATSGALFMATIGKQQNSSSLVSNLIPALSFNIGRILSYGLFGFIVGLIGSALLQNVIFSSILTAFIAIAMVLVGLNMTGLLSFDPLTNNNYLKSIFQRLESRFMKYPKRSAFMLGAITYLLPCGFTQSVQLYALSLANPVQSAIVMMIFALGTMPLLMALAYTNSFKNFSFYPYFQKIIGIIILVIGIGYITNSLALFGININIGQKISASQKVIVQNGYQVVRMSVDARGYTPNTFVVKQNVPVKWIVEGKNVFGCQGFLVSPQLNIQTVLKAGENVFEFTPSQKGQLNFSCSMGMYRGQFNVI